MKVTRTYWLGLGSGLILSAMIALVLSPEQGQAVTLPTPSPVPSVQQQETTQPLAQPSQDQPPNTPSSTLTPTPTTTAQDFIIPKGTSSEKIADLLVAQGFIKDKASFLESVHQMGVESKFRAGTFTLSLGLTTEELIRRLLK
ncbi:MAG TPA: ABC transporter substrate-binding protein [Desulfosporosinus sp.]|nr:ABC transporter substrate-binding protein [Desulfosporosinus sp.]